MEISRKNRSEKVQTYDFAFGKNEGIEMIYAQFEYPTEADKSEGAVKESLVINERYPNKHPSIYYRGEVGYFNDCIFRRFDGSISLKNENLFSISPSIRRYKQLPTEIRDEIAKNLSDEALKLLNEGLERYLER